MRTFDANSLTPIARITFPRAIGRSERSAVQGGSIALDEKKSVPSATIRATFENQSRVVHQVGKVADASIRVEGQIQMGLMIRERPHAAAV